MLYLVDLIRDDPFSKYNETYRDTFLAEMTEDQAGKIHDIIGARYSQDLIVNPIEINTFEELCKILGVEWTSD